jgi:hypothetical protein
MRETDAGDRSAGACGSDGGVPPTVRPALKLIVAP